MNLNDWHDDMDKDEQYEQLRSYDGPDWLWWSVLVAGGMLLWLVRYFL